MKSLCSRRKQRWRWPKSKNSISKRDSTGLPNFLIKGDFRKIPKNMMRRRKINCTCLPTKSTRKKSKGIFSKWQTQTPNSSASTQDATKRSKSYKDLAAIPQSLTQTPAQTMQTRFRLERTEKMSDWEINISKKFSLTTEFRIRHCCSLSSNDKSSEQCASILISLLSRLSRWPKTSWRTRSENNRGFHLKKKDK